LIDVLLGDMSLVGPRPEVSKYIDCYSDDEKHDVLSVKPGITDNTSIEFRDENELLAGYKDPEAVYINEVLPKKIALYRKYVRERSFFGDVVIIFKTVFLIINK
jgi:lipopolysaccharide/colanic/teichoic acid biosynthesis glycosyltransferase